MEAEINVKSDNNIIQLKESKDILRLKINLSTNTISQHKT